MHLFKKNNHTHDSLKTFRQQIQLLTYQPKPFLLDSIIFDIAMFTSCCTSWPGPADVAVSPLLPVEDTPPPPPLLPPSCLLHAAGFRKRKREYWCVFRKVWTSLTFWNQRYIYRKQVTVSYRKYTRTFSDTVKGIIRTDVRSVQSFYTLRLLSFLTSVFVCQSRNPAQHFNLENHITFIDLRRLKKTWFFFLSYEGLRLTKATGFTEQMFKVTGLIHKLCRVCACVYYYMDCRRYRLILSPQLS